MSNLIPTKTSFKKGHIRSIESREKQSKTMSGRVNLLAIERMNTPEANKKKGLKKEKNPNWISDRTKLVSKRSMTELRDWVKKIFTRDNYTCQDCGVVGGKLQAHHIKSYKLYPELRESLENGRTLCVECHKKTDNYAALSRLTKQKYAIS